MKQQPLPHEKIIFVCTNRREEGTRRCCADGGGEGLREQLKALVKARRLRSRIRVSQSGCMDRCEHGPNVMVFPDNVWFSGVREEDAPAIVEFAARSLDPPPPPEA
ncbi:MAG: (2Fe-2S) ferredoxin domain-containing protein [Candidatus Hydrogenedentes bacterium]|nr:(2Fe-2S) ferredoxin domain-containing protein [Candidatus Hydrogenedentota bacterium]